MFGFSVIHQQSMNVCTVKSLLRTSVMEMRVTDCMSMCMLGWKYLCAPLTADSMCSSCIFSYCQL